MKIEIKDSCFEKVYEVDDIDFTEMDKSAQRELIDKLLNRMGNLENILEYLVEENGDSEYKDLGTCDTCGQHCSVITLKIK